MTRLCSRTPEAAQARSVSSVTKKMNGQRLAIKIAAQRSYGLAAAGLDLIEDIWRNATTFRGRRRDICLAIE